MIEVSGNFIAEEVDVILNELKVQLSLNGIERFAKIVPSGYNIQTMCPFHKDGQERKPSFGILAKDRGNRKAGSCHCLACGWSGSLSEMISNCFGYDDFGLYGDKWLVKNFLSISVERRPDLDVDISRNSVHSVGNIHYVSEEELDKYRVYHPYMWTRKLTPEVVDIFDIGYDPDTDCLTFPVRDKDGNCLFVARRSVKTKYFNYPSNVEKSLYGLNELYKLDKLPEKLYITESMLDTTTLWTVHEYSVAMNGVESALEIKQLCELPIRQYIIATDNDEAGEKAARRLKESIPNKLFYRLKFPKGRKDVNEFTADELVNLEYRFY